MREVLPVGVLFWGAGAMRFFLERPSGRRLEIVLAASCVAILFKQTGIFLVGAVDLTIACCCMRGQVRVGHALVALDGGVGGVLGVVGLRDEGGATDWSGDEL